MAGMIAKRTQSSSLILIIFLSQTWLNDIIKWIELQFVAWKSLFLLVNEQVYSSIGLEKIESDFPLNLNSYELINTKP